MIEYHKNFSLESLPYINLEGLICWEEFRDVPDYEGLYQVSDLGRVKSLNYRHTRNASILKCGINSGGYLSVRLYRDKKSETRVVHQLVAITFLNHKRCGYELVVNHKNFIRIDNNLGNLEIVTQRVNANKKHLPSSSKYTGVYWNTKDKKWISYIFINAKRICLGYFDDELEASEYYENAVEAIKNGTEIQIKEVLRYSNYRGVTWNKNSKKWVASIKINSKNKHLGYFNTEEEASLYYESALLAIRNGEVTKVKEKATTSKYKGVSWHKGVSRWIAQITIDGNKIHIGTFKIEEDAHNARENYVKQIAK